MHDPERERLCRRLCAAIVQMSNVKRISARIQTVGSGLFFFWSKRAAQPTRRWAWCEACPEFAVTIAPHCR